MATASGVYVTITDNSIVSEGTQEISAIIPMLTQKGDIGLNYVTAQTMKDVLGYDLDYNSNYYGLSQILSSLSYAYVWRLNQNAYLGNMYLATSDASASSSLASCTTKEQLEALETNYMAVGHNSVGTWGTQAVKFAPTMQNQTQQNNLTNGTLSFTVQNVQTTEPSYVLNSTEYFGSLLIYDQEGTTVVGVLSLDSGTTYNVYKIVDGTVNTTSIGTASLATNTFTFSLTSGFNDDTFWNIKYVSDDYTEWTLTYSEYDSNTQSYSVINTYDFSTSSNSNIYYKDVDFGDLFLYLSQDVVPSSNTVIRSYCTLQNGSNGAALLSQTDVDTSVLKTSTANMIFMNGLTTIQIVNKIAAVAQAQKQHMFVDSPAFSSYIDTKSWKDSVYASEYVAVCAKPDEITQTDGSIIYVYPSVYYAEIYANMLSNTGTLNYPPAGYTYGTTSVTSLLSTDFSNFTNELKTNRINYQISTSSGSCIWEQRTTYNEDSDLSYIAPTFILDSLSSELVSFEKNYNFRYINSTNLLNQESGLKKILNSYVSDGFIYTYNLDVPTLSEAIASGRTLTITVEIQIVKDSEVIKLNIVLNS